MIATDLDRTLLPNGSQEYDGTMPVFRRVLKEYGFRLAFVTGRNLELVGQAMKEFNTPEPDFVISDVGTKVYSLEKGEFREDLGWAKQIRQKTGGWNIVSFRESLQDVGLRIQEEEKQNEFKLSYYLDDLARQVPVVKQVTKAVKAICRDAIVVYSVDETHNIGLIDILPKHATKLTALEHLRRRLGLKKKDIYYCGDSGNDILPLTHGYKSILVRNAIPEVRDTVRHLSIQKNIINNLHIAKGMGRLNGYYVSGIIEGLIKFGAIGKKYSE